jgi:hypothetical protein
MKYAPLGAPPPFVSGGNNDNDPGANAPRKRWRLAMGQTVIPDHTFGAFG